MKVKKKNFWEFSMAAQAVSRNKFVLESHLMLKREVTSP